MGEGAIPGDSRRLAHNLATLRADLGAAATTFRSWPSEAHVQMTTYCDMSCVMCWDGHNPPTVDIDEGALDAVRGLAARGLALVTPHDGSEPVARGWSRTHSFARESGVKLEVTTNAQTLTESRLRAALDVLDHLIISIDTHDPGLLEEIRPGANGAKVLANAARAAAIARDAGIPVTANAVLLEENFDTIADTIAWIGGIGIDNATIIRMKDVNGRSSAHDPFVTRGAHEVELARKRCMRAGEDAGVAIWWSVTAEGEPGRISNGPSLHEQLHDVVEELRGDHPGFCRFVHSSLRISHDGSTSPCGYAARGQLELGNVAHQPLEEVWNGPSAHDLRRAMYTRDLPHLCSTCIHALDPPPRDDHPVMADVATPVGLAQGEVIAERGVVRAEDPPSIELRGVPRSSHPLVLVLADPHGGSPRTVPVEPSRHGSRLRFDIPRAVWDELAPYAGHWFTVAAQIPGIGPVGVLRAAWCLVRAPWLERVEHSSLHYADGPADHEVNLGAVIPVRRPAR